MTAPPVLSRDGVKYDTDSPHLVACSDIANSAPEAQFCHVYLCGTGCNPTKNTPATWWLSTSADSGMAVIGLSYQWGPYSDLERNNILHDRCYGYNDAIQDNLSKYHSNVLFGGNDSGLVNVTKCNSVIGRLTSLLIYLQSNRSAGEGWGKFLIPKKSIPSSNACSSSNEYEINYERMIFSGHSQGSGHVCYLAKQISLARAVLLSGPQEFLDLDLESSESIFKHENKYKNENENENEEKDASDVQNALHNAVSFTSSWLDGFFATKDIKAFMHYREEQTADLIRQNWSRIAPISQYYRRNYTNIERSTDECSNCMVRIFQIFDWCPGDNPYRPVDTTVSHTPTLWYNKIDGEFADFKCSKLEDGFGNCFRTFFSRLPPSTQGGGRPNHNSMVSDRSTPVVKIRISDLPLKLQMSLLADYPPIFDYDSDFVDVPIYYMTIWPQLLKDIKPDRKSVV